MNHKKRTMLRRLTSVLMTLVMIFSLFPTGLTGRIGLVSTAEAATNPERFSRNFKTQFVNDAAKYLGYGYRSGGRFNNASGGDCTCLLAKVLIDMGFKAHAEENNLDVGTISYIQIG